MGDTYFVEERSGVIGLGPLRTSPEMYYRSNKTNWRSSTAWIHLIICLLAIPLIIWNLFLLMDTIINYTQVSVVTSTGLTGATLADSSEAPRYTAAHPLALLIVLSAILMNLLGGLFALVTEAACFSEKLAKFLYVMVYLSIAISIYALVFSYRLLGIVGLIVLFLFIICWGVGFWRFTIISAIYLNEEGPTWFKPLLYGCLAHLTEDEMYDMIKSNFERHYTTNRAPFGLYFHTIWFKEKRNFKALMRFIDEMIKKQDVWFVTNYQAIEWMRTPTPLSQITNFDPWKCKREIDPNLVACNHPNLCKLKSRQNKGEQRYLYTCFECPEVFPWVKNEFGVDQN